MNATLRALNRFGMGARVQDKDEISDPRNWLKSQLDPSRTGIQATNLPSLEEVGSALRQSRQSQNASDQETRRKGRRGLQQIAEKRFLELFSSESPLRHPSWSDWWPSGRTTCASRHRPSLRF